MRPLLLGTFLCLALATVCAGQVVVSVDCSSEVGTSSLEIGVTHVHSNWQNGHRSAVASVKKHLVEGGILLQNVHIMGWGPGSPSPSPGVYEWGGLDSRIELMRSMKARMIMTFCTAPGWMKTSGKDWSMNDRVADEHVDAYAELCRRAASRYRDIRHFQIWNEFKGYWDKGARGWDAVKYTGFYNKVYAAVRSARPKAKIGGFYKGFSEDLERGGTLSRKNWKLIDYWLKHNDGADFICFDGSIHGWPRADLSEAELMKRSGAFGRVAAQLRKKTKLPIWVSEFYAAHETGNAKFEAANHASAYYHSLINGTAVALHWDPVGFCPFFSSTKTASGGKPTQHYRVARIFNTHFGPGTKLVRSSSSDADVEVMASTERTLLINKLGAPTKITINGIALTLASYEVRLINTPPIR